VLHVPTPGQHFILYTDASANMVACQLPQYDEEGAEHPVAYASLKAYFHLRCAAPALHSASTRCAALAQRSISIVR